MPLPSADELAGLLETAFFATLTDDEERPTLFRIDFGPPTAEPAEGLSAAFTPRPLTVDAIRRVAPATTSTGASLGVSGGASGLELWGIVLPSPSDAGPEPGAGLHVAGRGRGALEVSVGRQRVASYVGGTLRLYEQYIHETELIRVVRQLAPRVAGGEPHVELRTIFRVADAMTDFEHGGTLLVVPDGPYDRIAGLRPSPRYLLDAGSRGLLARTIDGYRARSSGEAREGRRVDFAAVDFDRWERDRLLDRQARRLLADAVRLVAGFTAVDGALAMTANLDVLAFGAMIDVVPDAESTDVVSVDPFAPDMRRRRLPQAFGGARHQSAIAFCRQQVDGALAFVASHDGTLTFFLRSPTDVIALRPLDLSATR